jgi:hypothetical protein
MRRYRKPVGSKSDFSLTASLVRISVNLLNRASSITFLKLSALIPCIKLFSQFYDRSSIEMGTETNLKSSLCNSVSSFDRNMMID